MGQSCKSVREWESSEAINERRYVSCSEPVINIHNANVGSTGIHHAEEGGHSLKSRAISHAGWNRDHWNSNHASYDAWQCPFHSGADNHHPGIRDRLPMGKQAMNACNAHIVNTLHVVSH